MPRYGGKTMTSSFPLDIQGRRHCEPIYSVGLKDQRERRRQCAKRHHGKGDQQKRHISEHSERVLTRGAGAPERPSVDTHTHQSCGPTHRTGRPGPLKPLLYSAAIPRGAAGGHGGQLGPVHRPPPGIPPPPPARRLYTHARMALALAPLRVLAREAGPTALLRVPLLRHPRPPFSSRLVGPCGTGAAAVLDLMGTADPSL